MTKMRKAIVTGGCGFIGSHMVDYLLDRDFSVIVIDNLVTGRLENIEHQKKNPLLNIEEKDIRCLPTNSNIFENCDYVFHFAGIGDIVPSIEKPEKYMSNNVMGTVRILECARQFRLKKFIYAASSSCYGLANTPTDENHKIQPLYPYAISKQEGAYIVQKWNEIYNLPTNIICIFNAYGPRSKTNGAYGAVFGTFLKQKLANRPFTVVGDGNQKRDFIYVTDLVEAFFLAAESDLNGEIFNVGSGNPQTINYLIKLLGEGEKVYLPKRPGEPNITFANINKIKKLLNWSPKVPFEEGVKYMLENINYWENAPLWDEKRIENATKNWYKYMSK